MRVAPIIHTRTYACDFNSEFAVRPECFMDSDVKWARGNVLGATGEIDELRGVRWLVSDNGKYRMAGVVGFLKDICSKCQLNDADRTKSQELFYDNNGRLVYAFIGVVMDKQHNDFRELTFDYLWGIYLDKIYPIWKRTYQEVILEDFVEIDTKQITRSDVEEPSVVGESFFYETNSARDYKLFLNFLCDERETGFSFCSNILIYSQSQIKGFALFYLSFTGRFALKTSYNGTPVRYWNRLRHRLGAGVAGRRRIRRRDCRRRLQLLPLGPGVVLRYREVAVSPAPAGLSGGAGAGAAAGHCAVSCAGGDTRHRRGYDRQHAVSGRSHLHAAVADGGL